MPTKVSAMLPMVTKETAVSPIRNSSSVSTVEVLDGAGGRCRWVKP